VRLWTESESEVRNRSAAKKERHFSQIAISSKKPIPEATLLMSMVIVVELDTYVTVTTVFPSHNEQTSTRFCLR